LAYTYNINVYDSYGRVTSDIVVVYVVDNTVATVNNPSDIFYLVGTTGNEIIWDVSDLSPGVYNITRDGSVVVTTTTWTNGSIIVNIDGLNVGIYNFTIHLYDLYGNMVTDAVIIGITAVPDTSDPPSDTTPTDNEDESFLNYPSSALLGLLLAITLIRKKNRVSNA